MPLRKRVLPWLPLALLTGPCWAQGSVPLLDEVMARLAQPAERRAAFVEQKTLAALSTPLRSQGMLAYRKPDHLEKTTTDPAAESLVVDGGRLVVAGADAPRVVELDGQPEIRTLVDTIRGALSGDLALLRRSYDAAATGTPDAWQVTLRPRDPAVARLVREVHLAGGTDLRSIETVAPNGDVDLLTITPLPLAGKAPG